MHILHTSTILYGVLNFAICIQHCNILYHVEFCCMCDLYLPHCCQRWALFKGIQYFTEQRKTTPQKKKCSIALPTFLNATKQRRATPSSTEQLLAAPCAAQQMVKQIQHITEHRCWQLGKILNSFEQSLKLYCKLMI